MWKIVKSEIYYQNDMVRFSILFVIIYSLFYFFATIVDSSNIYSPDRILILILPALFSAYIFKHIQGVVLDIREKRGRQLLTLPVSLKSCGVARVIEPLILFSMWIVMSAFAFSILSYMYKDLELEPLQKQLTIYSKYFFSILLITITLNMAKDRFGAYLLTALAGIFAIIVFTPGLLIYYEEKLITAVNCIFSPWGSLILSVDFLIVILFSFTSRIYNDTINFNLQNIFFMVRDEISYMGARLKLRYQLLIGFVIAFFFHFIFMHYASYYDGEFNYILLLASFATLIIVYIVNNVGLLINEIIEKRVKLITPLPVKRSSVAFYRLLNPYTTYAAFIIIFVILYNSNYLLIGQDYGLSWADPDFYEVIAISSALFLIFAFLLRLASEISGRILLGIIALYFATYSMLMLNNYEWYYDESDPVSFYAYTVNFLIAFSQTFTGSVLITGLMAILLYYSFINRKSYLK